MNYSTTLPPGFKTWNEVFIYVKNSNYETDVYKTEDEAYSLDFIKARAFDDIMDNKITRVEVINHQDEKGRDFVKHGCDNVELQIQDEGRTLKIFITATH